MGFSTYIAGIHEPGGEHLLKPGGWIVFTEALGTNPHDVSTRDYRQWDRFGTIVRLNNGYEPVGTIPDQREWEDYLRRVEKFVGGSTGNNIWVIGNEMNLPVEWPYGQPIYPGDYGQLFQRLRQVIKSLPGHAEDLVIPGAPAPWNNSTKYAGNSQGDWVKYFLDTLLACGQVDGISLHAYTHGPELDRIRSDERMASPFEDRRYDFRAFEDFLAAVPEDMQRLPVYITEANYNQPWSNTADGWPQAALDYIDEWNSTAGNQTVHCLAFYRWPKYDDKAIDGKPVTQAQIAIAAAKGYRWTGKLAPFPEPADDDLSKLMAEALDREMPLSDPDPKLHDHLQVANVQPISGDFPYAGGKAVLGLDQAGKRRVYWREADNIVRWVREGNEGYRLDHHPIKNPAQRRRLTQPYGVNAAAYARFGLKGHNGVDYGLPVGTELVSPFDGEVTESYDDTNGYGRYLKIVREDGGSHCILAHLSSWVKSMGSKVDAGETVGYSGNTGNSTGPHLHFGLRIMPYLRSDGFSGYCDPLPYLERTLDVPREETVAPFGLDVSRHQGIVKWERVRDVDFIFQRWTVGDYYGDDRAFWYWSGIRDTGAVHSVYHVVASRASDGRRISAKAQMDVFLGSLGDRAADLMLPPVLDVELQRGASPQELEDTVLGCAEIVKDAGLGDPIIYTGAWFWDVHMPRSAEWKRFPLWVASYRKDSPMLPKDWDNWTFWQYTDKGTVPGFSSNVDLNRANMTTSRLREWSRLYMTGEVK